MSEQAGPSEQAPPAREIIITVSHWIDSVRPDQVYFLDTFLKACNPLFGHIKGCVNAPHVEVEPQQRDPAEFEGLDAVVKKAFQQIMRTKWQRGDLEAISREMVVLFGKAGTKYRRLGMATGQLKPS
ncbi:hypothetical protein MMC07_000604 [Pseudocyphellaria aurata]|nr:hypothetical protein [Pseudocyphellaria aurata]